MQWQKQFPQSIEQVQAPSYASMESCRFVFTFLSFFMFLSSLMNSIRQRFAVRRLYVKSTGEYSFTTNVTGLPGTASNIPYQPCRLLYKNIPYKSFTIFLFYKLFEFYVLIINLLLFICQYMNFRFLVILCRFL